jgi:uncharacterized DUF497 family protein
MIDIQVAWDDENEHDPSQFNNVRHSAEHGVSQDDVEDVIYDLESIVERGSKPDRFEIVERSRDGRLLGIPFVFRNRDPDIIYPITAFDEE